MLPHDPLAPKDIGEVYLEPGDTYFGEGDTRIRTILGSCVAITFWHPTKKIGGMCHFMLPARKGPDADKLDGRYAPEALDILEAQMKSYHTKITDYQAKVFGGGEMFAQFFKHEAGSETQSIGAQNIAAAQALMANKNVPILKSHTGDTGHRKVILDIWSGDVWLQHYRKPG